MYVLLFFLPVYLFILYAAIFRRTPACPECGEPLPRTQSPLTRTLRQWFEGGYVCPNCGCEVTMKGEPVPEGTGPRRGAVARGVLILAFSAAGPALIFLASCALRVNPPPPVAPPLLLPVPPIPAGPPTAADPR